MAETVAIQTPPVLEGHVPSEKEKKYDRQLRLWAASGQAALESANILLFNTGSGVVGVEALKNLILPGIGRFAIVDDATVQEADLGVNFFLDENSLGMSRAQSCTELLLELNPEVHGEWFPKNKVRGHSGPLEQVNFVELDLADELYKEPLDLERILSTSPTFTMIMYTLPIDPAHLTVLQAYGSKNLTPLVAIHSAGLYSYFRASLPGTFPVVDTHPDEASTTDLRLLSPWPELREFAIQMTKDLDSMDNHEHGHIPYVVILLHYLEQWKATHGEYPKNYAEKTEFRKLVAGGARRDNPEGGEENFEEAAAAVVKTVVPSSLPSSLKEVFDYIHTQPIEARSSFWVIADAVCQFYKKHNCLPLPGNVPDMKAQSKVYIQLQNIYKAKARKDVAEVLGTVRQSPGGKDVDPGEVELFCKNAAFVKLVNSGATGADRLAKVAKEELDNDVNMEAMMMPLTLIPIYLALRATSHNGEASPEEILRNIGDTVPEAAQNERLVKISREVARAGGGELHNTSALTGGMVAQEVIKIITKQYIPVDNTCIFDGISSRCQVLRL